MQTIQVETYEERELNLGDELNDLALQGQRTLLIEELHLGGQRDLENGKTHAFRYITEEEKFVFEMLFPNKTCIMNYGDAPIPLRVMEIAAEVKRLDHPHMRFLEVWHPAKGIDDPVLVARDKPYGQHIFLLARWGKALRPFEELKEMAIKQGAAFFKSEVEKAKRILATIHDPAEIYADAVRGGHMRPSLSFYCNIL